MTMQLYTVKLHAEVVVLAESTDAAEHIAIQHRADEESFQADATPMCYLPETWGREFVPYQEIGSDDFRELGELLDAGLAPAMAGSTWTSTERDGEIEAVSGKGERRRFVLSTTKRPNGRALYSIASAETQDDPFIYADTAQLAASMLHKNLKSTVDPIAHVNALLSGLKLPAEGALRRILDRQQNDGTLTREQWEALRDAVQAIVDLEEAFESWKESTT